MANCNTSKLNITARQQVRDMFENLKGLQFGTVWLDIEGGDWYNNFYKDPLQNQAFLIEMVDEILKYGHTPGFYSNWNYWDLLLGGNTFKIMSKYPIWYIYIYIYIH